MKILKWMGAALALLLVVLLFNALRVSGGTPPPEAVALPDVADGAIERLAGALRIPTVTHSDTSKVDWSQWPKLHDYLEAQFPAVHRTLRREQVSDYSLLYTWEGSDPQSRPFLMLAHMDVVPIEPGTESNWKRPPFAGEIVDGFLWGRGALDDKSSLIGQLEAVEALVQSGFQPRRTVYFAFGHDEEIGGREGAAKMAALLEQRGVRAEFALDEGGAITKGVIAGVDAPIAMVATAEKGYVSFRLTTRDAGGHSSRPPAVTAIGRLSAAVSRLEANPFPLRLAPPVDTMLERLAPELPFGQRLAITNLWLFRPLVAKLLSGAPLTGAMVRTTTAPTVFHAGIKDNVLPSEAYAVVNFRVLPGDSRETVERHIRRVIDDPDVGLSIEEFASEPSPVADVDAPSFRTVERVVHEIFPGTLVAPGLVIAATDNRHYAGVRDAAYNFAPVLLTDEDVSRIHGSNERIAIEAYEKMVQFYVRFLEQAAGPS